MKKILGLIFILLLITTTQGQTKKIDSLWVMFNETKLSDTVRFNSLDQIFTSGHFYPLDDTTLSIAKLMLNFSQKTSQKKNEARSLHYIARWYHLNSNPLKALEYSLMASQLYEELGEKLKTAYDYDLIANSYYFSYNYAKALEYELKALSIFQEYKETREIALAHSFIANIYKKTGNYNSALEQLHESLNTFKSLNEATTDIDLCYLYIGDVYYLQNKYDLSLEYYSKAVDESLSSMLYSRMGKTFKKLLNYPKATEYCLKTIQLTKANDDKFGAAPDYLCLGEIYFELSKYDKAKQYTDTSLQIAIEYGDAEIKRKCFKNISNIYSKTGYSDSAFHYLILYNAITDSLYNSANNKSFSDVNSEYLLDKKKQEYERSKAIAIEEKKRQELLVYTIAFILLIVLVFSFLLNKRLQLTKQQKHIIEEKNNDILDSIRYAKRIQTSLLPTDKYIERVLTKQDKNNKA